MPPGRIVIVLGVPCASENVAAARKRRKMSVHETVAMEESVRYVDN